MVGTGKYKISLKYLIDQKVTSAQKIYEIFQKDTSSSLRTLLLVKSRII